MRRYLLVPVLATWLAGSAAFRLVIASREAGKPARIVVIPEHHDDLAPLMHRAPTNAEWEAMLALTVAGQNEVIAGKYRLTEGKLIFESKFALVGGVSYQARFDPSKLTGKPATPIVEKFTVVKPAAKARPVVTSIYPSADTLPCNTLKFYLLFSRPMREGLSFDQFEIVDDKNKAVKTPFREVELWNESRTRLTLYIHPGRIKRGVKLREEMGTVLEPNRKYTLIISQKLTDVDGNELAAPFRKTFLTTGADHAQPKFDKWKLTSPHANTREALVVELDERLDHALLQRMITVESANSKRVMGTVALEDHERCWRLTPKTAWTQGTHRLIVDTDLEDLAGNSLRKPFEVDVAAPVKKAPDTLTREFVVK